MSVRRLALATWLVIVVLVAVGIVLRTTGGSRPKSPFGLEGVAKAASTTAHVRSGRFGFVLEQALPDGETVSVTGTGGFDTGMRKASVSLDLSTLGSLLDSFVPVGSRAEELLENEKLWKLDAVEDDELLYLRLPILEKFKSWPRGKRWARIDLHRLGVQRRTWKQLERYGSSDARDLLPCLRAVTGTLTRVGKERLSDTEAVHYQATIDVRKYRRLERKAPRFLRASLPNVLLADAHPRRVPVDVWIDDEGLVRKFQLSFPSSNPDTQGPVEASIRFEFYDLGQKVAIPVPPNRSVVDSGGVAV